MRAGTGRRWSVGVAKLGVALAWCGFAGVASAQRLTPVGDEQVDFDVAYPAFVEDGALVAVGFGASQSVELRVDGTAVSRREAPVPTSARSATVFTVVCGGRRWLLEYHDRDRSYGARPAGGIEGWSHRLAPGEAAVELRCAGEEPLVGWLADGELVTVRIAASPRLERRTRLWPAGPGELVWIGGARDELFAIGHAFDDVATTSLVRIAGGAVTHRRELPRAGQSRLALGSSAVSVVTEDAAALRLRSFARTDLSPAPRSQASIRAAAPNGSLAVRAAWPMADGRVVIGYVESWRGPEMLRSPLGPLRDEPEVHRAAGLRVWSPREGRVGPRLELDSEEVGDGALLGERFVLLQRVEAYHRVRIRRISVERGSRRPSRRR